MRNDVEDDVGVAGNLEIEAPFSRHARLPAVIGFVIFLGMQAGCWRLRARKLICLMKAF